jgi:hypothetical protein
MKAALEHIKVLRGIISPAQLNVMGDGCRREERSFFFDKFEELATTFKNMPKTYEQDGKGDQAVAYLHYFTSSRDFYITEKDMEDEQHQAFGLVVTSEGSELGYISLIELAEFGAELDLHFEPTTIGDIKASL